MLSILKLLRNNPLVKEYKILDFIEDKIPKYYFYIKVEVILWGAPGESGRRPVNWAGS